MIAMPILNLHHLSTSVKGHNDISVKSYALPVFFPGGLQSDLFLCSCTLLRVRIRLFHYVILHEAGWLAL